MSLQQWRENREAAGTKIIELRDRIAADNRDFTADEREAWERANKDFDYFSTKIEDMTRAKRVERAMKGERAGGVPGANGIGAGVRGRRDRGAGGEERELDQSLAMQAWFLRQSGKPLSDAHRRACRSIGFSPNTRTLDIYLPKRGGETRAQSVGTPSAGGYLVPQGFVNKLERAMKDFNGVRKVAEIIRTDNGQALPWPTVNDTTNSGTLLSENAAVAEVPVTFGQTSFAAYKFTSGLVLVSAELDADSAIDMTETVGSLIGERLGRGQATYFTTGTGVNQPGGIVTGAALGVTAASMTAIAADELFSLYHSVDPAYRDDPSCGWMFHDNIAMTIRKLKDAQGRYLLDMDALRNGMPETLLGKPYTVNQAMASTVATTNKTILFGALSKMKIRDAGPIRIRKFVERYGDYDQVGFVAFARSDSKVLNAGTSPIKYLQQA